MNKLIYPFRANSSMLWLWAAFIILTILLILKISWNNILFSYQWISDNTPWYTSYISWINLINSLINNSTWDKEIVISKTKEYLRKSISESFDKKLISYGSGQLLALRNIELIEETKECIDLLVTWYLTIIDIKENFLTISSGYSAVSQILSERIKSLPSSSTKTCLEQYLQNLESSLQLLTNTYKNISSIHSDYTKSLESYNTNGWGLCPGIEDVVHNLSELQNQILLTLRIIDSVKNKLNSYDIKEYDSLCIYGTIQWLTWLQEKSWSVKQTMDTFEINLIKSSNVKEYVQKIIDSLSGSIVNINTTK